MKILALTRYGRRGASSRVRFHQYFPLLRGNGIQLQVSSFLGDEYVKSINLGNRNFREILFGYIRRIRSLLAARKFDLIWIEKDALPWVPWLVERAIFPSGIPYALDYDDAVFHNYDIHKSAWIRGLLGGKHDRIMRSASLVMVGNEYLAERARRAGARNIEVVPTVVDVTRYRADAGERDARSVMTVGWIGQRFNAHYLRIMEEPIRRLSASGLVRFVAIGSGNVLTDLPIASIPWSEDTEVQRIAEFDVGVMPVPDEPFERGKCGYKLIQYMACSKPVVASPVGVNKKIVQHGLNGFLATSGEEWGLALEKLARSSEMRQAFGARGFKMVERDYSLQVWAPRIAGLLRKFSGA